MLENRINQELPSEGSLTPQEYAGVIIRVLEEAHWGRGSIVETQKITVESSEDTISVRDVHLEALYPPIATPKNILG